MSQVNSLVVRYDERRLWPNPAEWHLSKGGTYGWVAIYCIPDRALPFDRLVAVFREVDRVGFN